MASLRKLPNSKYWIACYTDHNGKQRQRSTREINRIKALKITNEYEEAYSRFKTEAQARKVLSDIYQEVHGENLASSSIKAFLEHWIARKKVEVRQTSYERYKPIIEQFLGFLGSKAERDLAFIESKDFAAYRDFQVDKISGSTANTHMKILRMAFKDAWRDNLINDNPAAKISNIRAKADQSQRRAFTMDELKAVLKAAEGEWRGMILFGVYTGQRLGDIAKLTWDKIDFENKLIKLSTTKTGRTVSIPIAKALLKWIKTQAKDSHPKGAIFPNAYDILKRTGKAGSLSNQFYRIMTAAGLVEKRSNKATGKGRSAPRDNASNLSFHCLRHTATSMLKNAGVSEAIAMDIIGHESKAISTTYTHIEDKAKREALDRLPEI